MDPNDLLNGLDELDGDELAAAARKISPAALQTNPVKFAPFTGAAGATTVPLNDALDFTINPSRNMIVAKIVIESATTGNANGLQVTGIEFGDERQTLATGRIPGSAFNGDSTVGLRLGVLPKGINSTIRVANVTGANIDDVAVCAIGWCGKKAG